MPSKLIGRLHFLLIFLLCEVVICLFPASLCLARCQFVILARRQGYINKSTSNLTSNEYSASAGRGVLVYLDPNGPQILFVLVYFLYYLMLKVIYKYVICNIIFSPRICKKCLVPLGWVLCWSLGFILFLCYNVLSPPLLPSFCTEANYVLDKCEFCVWIHGSNGWKTSLSRNLRRCDFIRS
jgi:hypothetical protein